MLGVGLIVGSFSATGLAGTLVNDLVFLAGNAVLPLLIMGAVTAFIFGMGMRQIFNETTGTDRHMLVFEGANYNAAAPIESWQPSDKVAFTLFFHYGDAAWDTNRMNKSPSISSWLFWIFI
ncbi:hypothetical protein Q5Y75_23440 [Ruegeria sp. 2205SS24-7]|uniref:hypothetical protein n=1 Tax=Ruegeria discodermiae TaxID=3064389 RepID=UPI002740F00E|nr:hypothetical protein [Ruegeria sp. 2205SS24-7]MDP5220152.1 hypothetical protein [Ruegeria sp. 2205SS24-7]